MHNFAICLGKMSQYVDVSKKEPESWNNFSPWTLRRKGEKEEEEAKHKQIKCSSTLYKTEAIRERSLLYFFFKVWHQS